MIQYFRHNGSEAAINLEDSSRRTQVVAILYGIPTAKSVPYIIAVIELAFGLWLTWNSAAKQ